MSPNKINNNSSENLTRRQKLLRRVGVPLAMIAAIGAIHHGVSKDKNPEQEAAMFTKATTTVNVSAEFGGSESDWGHGTATALIEEAVAKGVHSTGFDIDLDGTSDISEKETEEILKQVPTFNQANQLLDMAGYNEALPDEGDILQAKIEVTTDADKKVSYEVIDAQIKDTPNNQE